MIKQLHPDRKDAVLITVIKNSDQPKNKMRNMK